MTTTTHKHCPCQTCIGTCEDCATLRTMLEANGCPKCGAVVKPIDASSSCACGWRVSGEPGEGEQE